MTLSSALPRLSFRTAAFVLLAGCGRLAATEQAGAPDGGFDREAARAACELQFDVMTDFAARCGVPDGDRSAAREWSVEICVRELELPGTPPDLAARIEACQIERSRLACNQWTGGCEGMSIPRGTQEPGESCETGAQCTSGACTVNGIGRACGTCIEEVAVGAPCEAPTVQCETDAACIADSRGGRTCVARKKAGESCTRESSPCERALHCVAGACAAELPGPGEPCADFECAGALVCTAGTCGSGPGVGEPCPNGQCGANATCDFDAKTCVGLYPERTLAELGERCSGTGTCALGLFCKSAAEGPWFCAKASLRGEPCTHEGWGGQQCAIGSACTPEGTCGDLMPQCSY